MSGAPSVGSGLLSSDVAIIKTVIVEFIEGLLTRISASEQRIIKERTERDKHLEELYRGLQFLQTMRFSGDRNNKCSKSHQQEVVDYKISLLSRLKGTEFQRK